MSVLAVLSFLSLSDLALMLHLAHPRRSHRRADTITVQPADSTLTCTTMCTVQQHTPPSALVASSRLSLILLSRCIRPSRRSHRRADTITQTNQQTRLSLAPSCAQSNSTLHQVHSLLSVDSSSSYSLAAPRSSRRSHRRADTISRSPENQQQTSITMCTVKSYTP